MEFFLQRIKTQKFWFYSALLALLAIAAFFLFWHLGTRPLIDWDESIYAQVAKEALLNHRPFHFTFFGKNWFDKPPLMVWLTELSFSVFGITEWGARFFTALFALATILLTYFFAVKISGKKLAGLLTVLAYFICYHFFYHAYFLEFDIPVGFFILLSIFSFLLALEKPKFFYLFFASLALGVLTKSVVGLLPLPILLLYCLLIRRFDFLKLREFYYGLAMFFLIAAPWHIIESILFGKTFWQAYLFYHVISRFVQPIENNGGPFWYYLPTLYQNYIFGFLSGVSVVYFLIRAFKIKTYALPVIAFVFIFLFFSASQTKGDGYVTVMYPYLLSIIGVTLADLLKISPYRLLSYIAALCLGAVFIGLAWQEDAYKMFKLETDRYYNDNKNIAAYINANYPATPVYALTWVEGNLALDYYLGRYIPALPKGMTLPAHYFDAKNRVFHAMKRSVYKLDGYLYLAP